MGGCQTFSCSAELKLWNSTQVSEFLLLSNLQIYYKYKFKGLRWQQTQAVFHWSPVWRVYISPLQTSQVKQRQQLVKSSQQRFQ